MIEVQEVTKQYGAKVVLDNVGMQFNKGKITSLIGANGAGKSTLLSIISRLLSQDDGVILVDEKNVTEYKSKMLAQRLSILKQSNHVRLKLTVRELVSFGRFPYSQEKLTKEDIKMVVAQDTEYILLDEPLNNLDMKHSVQTMKIMRKLADELNKTVIIVLHDINFASHYSDYIVALKDGKIKYHDTTENIIKEDVLKDVFDIDIKIFEFDNKRICNYF